MTGIHIGTDMGELCTDLLKFDESTGVGSACSRRCRYRGSPKSIHHCFRVGGIISPGHGHWYRFAGSRPAGGIRDTPLRLRTAWTREWHTPTLPAISRGPHPVCSR